MKIIYVHHANRKIEGSLTQEDDLTKLGYKDCKLVADLLNNKAIKQNIKAIYTSSFFRCTKTAEIINSKIKVKIIKDDRLNEFRSVKGESWVDAQKRTIACIDDIIKEYGDKDIVICVTSGVNLGAFMCKAFNIEPTENTPYLILSSCSPIGFEFKKQNN